MSDSQPITGYRQLTEAEINLINEVKETGKRLDQIINSLTQVECIDKRWLSIGKTDLQKGLMAVVRSIARPESF